MVGDIILFRYFSIFGMRPNVWLIYIVFVSLFIGHLDAVTVGFLCGIVLDILDFKIFGLYSFVLTTIGYLCGWLYKKVDETLLNVKFIVLFLSSVVYLLLLSLCSYIFSVNISVSWKWLFVPFIDTIFGIFLIELFILYFKQVNIIYE